MFGGSVLFACCFASVDLIFLFLLSFVLVDGGYIKILGFVDGRGCLRQWTGTGIRHFFVRNDRGRDGRGGHPWNSCRGGVMTECPPLELLSHWEVLVRVSFPLCDF